MPDTPERLSELEEQLRQQEEVLFVLQSAKDAGLELNQDEAGAYGKLPEMIAATKSEIAGARRGLGLDR
jgi:hypothetical protein